MGSIPIALAAIFVLAGLAFFFKKDILEHVYSLVLALGENGSVPSKRILIRAILNRYCQGLREGDLLKVLRIPSDSGRWVATEDVFVTPKFRHSGPEKARAKCSSLLDLGQRIVLVGASGSGKSTLLKHLALERTTAILRSKDFSLTPVYYELKILGNQIRDMSPDEANVVFLDEIRKVVNGFKNKRYAASFAYFMKRHSILFLLDGLDELPEGQQDNFIRILKRLDEEGRINPRSQIVLSVKRQRFEKMAEPLMDSFTNRVELLPFDSGDIRAFITNWPVEDSGKDIRTRIHEDLDASRSLREMCSTPMILAMYMAHIENHRQEDSVFSRTGFYDRIVRNLLRKMLQGQNGSRSREAIESQLEELLDLLGSLAANYGDENALGRETAIAIMNDALRGKKRTSRDPMLFLRGRELLESLIEGAGLLEPLKRESAIRFVHSSFYNFFLAHHVVRENSWRQFLEARSARSANFAEGTLEAVPFVCGLLKDFEDQKKLLGRLLRNGEYALLGRCILEADRRVYRESLTEEFLKIQKEKLAGLLRMDGTRDGETGPIGWKEDLDAFHAIARETTRLIPLASARETRLAEFYADWIEREHLNADMLVESIARHSALQAIRLADKCGVAWSKLDSAILISGCRQESFFRKIAQQTIQDPQNRKWPMILTESALRYKSVNTMLNNSKEIATWGVERANGGKGPNWIHLKKSPPYYDTRTSQSNLTRCLDYVLSSGTVPDKQMHFLSLLQFITPSGKHGPRIRMNWVLCLIGCILCIIAISASVLGAMSNYVSTRHLSDWSRYGSFIAGSGLILVLLLLFIRRQYGIVTAYNWILMNESRSQVPFSSGMFNPIKKAIAWDRGAEFSAYLQLATASIESGE